MEALDRNGNPIEVGDVITFDSAWLYGVREITFDANSATVTVGKSFTHRKSDTVEKVELDELKSILFNALPNPTATETLDSLAEEITALFENPGEGGE